MGPVNGGEGWGSKALSTVLTGVVTSLVLLVVTPPVASMVSARLRQPTCSNPLGLRLLTGVKADGEHLVDATGAYPPSNVVDGNTSTTWADGRDGLGLGSVMTFELRDEADLRLVCIVNGYAKSWDLYRRNSRVRLAVVGTDQGKVDWVLDDSGTTDRPAVYQAFRPVPGRTETVTLTVRSAYAAQAEAGKNSYADTCISEVEFWAAD